MTLLATCLARFSDIMTPIYRHIPYLPAKITRFIYMYFGFSSSQLLQRLVLQKYFVLFLELSCSRTLFPSFFSSFLSSFSFSFPFRLVGPLDSLQFTSWQIGSPKRALFGKFASPARVHNPSKEERPYIGPGFWAVRRRFRRFSRVQIFLWVLDHIQTQGV